MKRIVLAFSGGLDTSIAIPWLIERYGAEIVAVTVDVGYGRELEAVRDRALAAGAVRAHVLDLKEEFARDYVLPALKADAMFGDGCLLARPLARALIARTLVDIAKIERADAVAHGGSRRGSDQAQFEVAARALNPGLTVVVPAREWSMTRSEALAYASQRGIPVPAAIDGPYRIDANLWGCSIVCESRESRWHEPAEEIDALTGAPADGPDEPASVEITFARGVPVAVNGVTMPMLDLIGSLRTIGGAHGVGRVDPPGNQLAGVGSHTIHEAPAAVVLHAAHQELQRLVTSPDLERFARTASLQYADVVANGRWFTPMHRALDAFVESVQERVSGAVRVSLFKGECRIAGVASPYAIHGTPPAAPDLLPAEAGAEPRRVTT